MLEINSLQLLVTTDCNLNCSYCYIKKQKKTMDLGVAKAAIDLLSKSENNQLVVFGGEPLLVPDLAAEVVKYAVKKNINEIILTTNGTIYSKELAEVLKKNKVGVQISVDSYQESQRHRRFKSGESSYGVVIKNLKKYINAGIKVSISITVDPENVNNLSSNFLNLSTTFKDIRLILATCVEWTDESVQELNIQLDKINNYFLEYLKKERKIPDFSFVLGNIKKIALNPQFRPPSCSENKMIAVMPNGDCYPCVFLKELDEKKFKIGNILQDKLDPLNIKTIHEKVDMETKLCKNSPAEKICHLYDGKMKKFNKSQIINMVKAQNAVMESTKRLYQKMQKIIKKDLV
jgi:radical SAM protein with 4Fe4S-binding SPASM domain